MNILEMEPRRLRKIISGGQVGADRGGLEAARDLGLETGGTAPLGYRVEGGDDPSLRLFGLVQSASREYAPRTRDNVRDSDATLIIASNPGSPGCHLTQSLCRLMKKPTFIVRPGHDKTLGLADWVSLHNVEVLNVAGNRDKHPLRPRDVHYDAAYGTIRQLVLELRRRAE